MRIPHLILSLTTAIIVSAPTFTSQACASAGYFDLDPQELPTAIVALKSSPLYEDPKVQYVSHLCSILESAQRPESAALRALAHTSSFKNAARKALTDRPCAFGNIRTPLAQQTLAQVQENFKNTLKDNADQKRPDQSALFEQVQAAYTQEIPAIESALSLYEAFRAKYGPFKSTKVAGTILNLLQPTFPKEPRQAIYEALTSTGFMTNLQHFNQDTMTFDRTTAQSVRAFLTQNGPIEELGLGDGTSLSTDTAKLLGIAADGACAARTFGTADIQAKALRIDISADAVPDVVCDMHDPALYATLLAVQGPASLSKVADRSWYALAHTNPEALQAITTLLKSGGIFEFYGVGDDANHAISDIVLPQGFRILGYDAGTNVLQFQKN